MPVPVSRRRYADDFKRNAVRTLLDSGKPVTAVAAEIGVEQSILHKWKKKFAHEFPGPGAQASGEGMESADIVSLRRELESVKETVDHLRNIVKKILGSKYSP